MKVPASILKVNPTIFTTVPETIPKTIPKTNPTTVPTIYYSSTIFEQISITEKTSTTIVEKKDSTEIILPNTTIIVNNTLIEEIDEYTFVVFLGFSHFKMLSNNISFYTYFAPIKNAIISKKLKFPIAISYETNMRVLKETEGDCTLNEIITPLNYQYLCEVHEDTSNIKSIAINPDFKFLSQEDIDVIGITPLAKMFMNNLLLCDKKFDKISNSTIYLLDDSICAKYDKLLFNITGDDKSSI